MSDADKEADSARVLQKTGERGATLCIVVGGVTQMVRLSRPRLLTLIATGVEALRKQDEH